MKGSQQSQGKVFVGKYCMGDLFYCRRLWNTDTLAENMVIYVIPGPSRSP